MVVLSAAGVILSWAVPGQTGYGHVNEQPNGYVIEQMRARGFAHDSALSSELRQAVQQHGWLRNTLAAFSRDGGGKGGEESDGGGELPNSRTGLQFHSWDQSSVVAVSRAMARPIFIGADFAIR